MKMCLLKSHNLLGINNGSYSFGNFFSNSSYSSSLETQETCEYSLKLLFVISKKVEESSHTKGSNNNTKQFFHLLTSSLSSFLETQ